MKSSILSILVLTILLGCASERGGPNGAKIPSAPKADGGVDVGNMTSAVVPRTAALIFFPDDWMALSDAEVLKIQNNRGSMINARKAEIKDLASPNAIGLKNYLEAKFPGRTYETISINGLDGVRAEIVNSDSEKQSDIFLVSEFKDFIHIQSSLKIQGDGIASGDRIILSVRVPYKGSAYPNPTSKTVTLSVYGSNRPDRRRAAYSILNDCYSYVDQGCHGVSMSFGNGSSQRLDIGNAGYDHGRIIELGPESEVPFDQIRVDGPYLVAPQSKVALSDIYTVFTPKNPQIEVRSLSLKEGYVYLIRTVSWPREDLIAKIRVDKLTPGQSTTLTYTKLVFVEPKTLKAQVDAINKFTRESEQPLSEGEVTLYNRSKWNSFFHASFNFEHSTSGNMFITYNSWDLLFDGRGQRATLSSPLAVGSVGEVIDIGPKSLDQISFKDFPDPNSYQRRDAKVVTGHAYLVYHLHYGGRAVYGAVQVLGVGPSGDWIRLKFKRIAIQEVGHFQRWIDLKVPQGIQSLTLEQSNGSDFSKTIFYPFINERADQGRRHSEDLSFDDSDGGYLRVDPRPYGDKRGFHRLGRYIPLNFITLARVEGLRGRFRPSIPLNQGDVIAVLLENYYDKTVLVMKVESYTPGKRVQLSLRYLYRGKTQYSADGD